MIVLVVKVLVIIWIVGNLVFILNFVVDRKIYVGLVYVCIVCILDYKLCREFRIF